MTCTIATVFLIIIGKGPIHFHYTYTKQFVIVILVSIGIKLLFDIRRDGRQRIGSKFRLLFFSFQPADDYIATYQNCIINNAKIFDIKGDSHHYECTNGKISFIYHFVDFLTRKPFPQYPYYNYINTQ